MAGLRNLSEMDPIGNPAPTPLSTVSMRKFWPALLLVPPMLAAWIWAGLSLGTQTDARVTDAPIGPEIRVRRTGVETLAPTAQTQVHPIEHLPPMTPHLAQQEFTGPGAGLTRIQGEVFDDEGRPVDAVVFSTECPSRGYAEGGRFELYFFAQGPMECDVQASTQHGMLSAISETVWVEVEPEDHASVRLHIDAQPQGGLGVAFELNGEGARITWVHPGGPGMQGGLQAGDVILQVDGQDFVGVYDQNAFIQTTVGPVGTQVSLLLEGESQIRTFTRGHIDEDTAMLDEAEPSLGPIDDADGAIQDSGWLPEWETGWLDTGSFDPETEGF